MSSSVSSPISSLKAGNLLQHLDRLDLLATTGIEVDAGVADRGSGERLGRLRPVSEEGRRRPDTATDHRETEDRATGDEALAQSPARRRRLGCDRAAPTLLEVLRPGWPDAGLGWAVGREGAGHVDTPWSWSTWTSGGAVAFRTQSLPINRAWQSSMPRSPASRPKSTTIRPRSAPLGSATNGLFPTTRRSLGRGVNVLRRCGERTRVRRAECVPDPHHQPGRQGRTGDHRRPG